DEAEPHQFEGSTHYHRITTMVIDNASMPGVSDRGHSAGNSQATLSTNGEIEIAGRRYIGAEKLARLLGVSVRTLSRRHSTRSGPGRSGTGRIVLYDTSKVPAFLASHETEPVRDQRSGRRA